MLLTAEQLQAMILGASDRKIAKYFAPINATLEEFSINTSKRIAAFIAQIAHESGNLYYVQEIASGSAYEYRKDLGNLEQEALDIAHAVGYTTGRFYKGRGLIQVTGFYNYKACGVALGLDLIHNPILLTDPMAAARSAGWFFATHGCNTLADRGNIKAITRVINGGYNGLQERTANYTRCKRILNIP